MGVTQRRSALLVAVLMVAGCTSESEPPSSDSATTNGPLAFDTGIQGTLARSGDVPGGDALEGQVLVWATSEVEPSGTTTEITLLGRPTEAVPVNDGGFAVELGSGLYRVRGTAVGGEVCGEFVVEVKPHEIAQADFVCSS